MTSKQKKVLVRIIISLVLFVLLAVIFHDFSGSDGDGSLFIRFIEKFDLSEGWIIATA